MEPEHQSDGSNETVSSQEMVPIVTVERERNFGLDDDSSQISSPSHSHEAELPDMSAVERFRLVVSLWPYIIPIFGVYTAEYACQSGAWTAIGFPTPHSVEARARFYERANCDALIRRRAVNQGPNPIRTIDEGQRSSHHLLHLHGLALCQGRALRHHRAERMQLNRQ